jgi:phenylacetic acid degradation operon negative regulatory protein
MRAPDNGRNLPAIQPLTARSVVLSTLLGYHPPVLPVSALVRVGGLFDIAEGTIRAALSRLVAAGDLVADDGIYQLTERLVRRQRRQDDSASPRYRPWTGDWEMAVVTTPARPQAERVALRKAMIDLRLGELREGVWLRPGNLVRQADGPVEGVMEGIVDGTVAGQCTFFRCGCPDSLGMSRQLWDLPAWAAAAHSLHAELGGTSDPAQSPRPAIDLKDGFILIARVVRHLRLDPCLPPELLPRDWPAPSLRDRYTTYRDQFAQRLRDYSAGLPPGTHS